jgi:hypothetical protein
MAPKAMRQMPFCKGRKRFSKMVRPSGKIMITCPALILSKQVFYGAQTIIALAVNRHQIEAIEQLAVKRFAKNITPHQNVQRLGQKDRQQHWFHKSGGMIQGNDHGFVPGNAMCIGTMNFAEEDFCPQLSKGFHEVI